MFIIGITGSIGSGKSTVSRLLSDMASIPVVDADSIARELVEPGREALVSIVEVFGNEMICEDGTLNRKKLGDLIFNDTEARAILNKIMFPLIRKRVLEYFNIHSRAGNKYLIYDAPLLFESKTDDLVDYIVLVYIPRDVQIQRICDRNSLTWEQATARIDAQPSSDELLSKPKDYLVRNTSDFIGLNSIIASLWNNIQEKKKK